MSNPNKQKGTRWESDIVRYLHDNGFPDARRVVQTGRYDTGDVWVRDFVIQAKAVRDLATALSDGTSGAVQQRDNAGMQFGVAVVKRPRKNVRDAYAVMPLEEFVRLLHAYYGEQD